MPRDLVLDFRQGGGSVPEIVHGIVRLWGTEVRPNATSLVLTTETTLKLSEGKATLLNAQTSGTGPLYDWAYIIQVEPFHGRNFRFYVAIPDGTGPVNLKDLPKLNPYTGEGFYVDIEEWEALYGDLPNRVDALEASQATQDVAITDLEARPIGNTSMRIDTTVGTRVFITDGITEKLVSGDTGWRTLTSWGTDGVVSGDPLPAGLTPDAGKAGYVRIRRTIEAASIAIAGTNCTTSYPVFSLPVGFRPTQAVSTFFATSNSTARGLKVNQANAFTSFLIGDKTDASYATRLEFNSIGAWPTTLPGTPA